MRHCCHQRDRFELDNCWEEAEDCSEEVEAEAKGKAERVGKLLAGCYVKWRSFVGEQVSREGSRNGSSMEMGFGASLPVKSGALIVCGEPW